MSNNDSLIRYLNHFADKAPDSEKAIYLNAVEELICQEKQIEFLSQRNSKFSGALMHIGYGVSSICEAIKIARETLDPQRNAERSDNE